MGLGWAAQNEENKTRMPMNSQDKDRRRKSKYDGKEVQFFLKKDAAKSDTKKR